MFNNEFEIVHYRYAVQVSDTTMMTCKTNAGNKILKILHPPSCTLDAVISFKS